MGRFLGEIGVILVRQFLVPGWAAEVTGVVGKQMKDHGTTTVLPLSGYSRSSRLARKP